MELTHTYSKRQLYTSIFLLFLLKSVITAVSRCIYPFAGFFAAGMGIPVGHLFLVLSFGELIASACPLLGPYADRVGPRRMILASSVVCGVAVALLGPGLSVFPLFIIA